MSPRKNKERVIRASEIGGYVFCRRAWWYRRQGIAPQNLAELAAGSAAHDRHGRSVRAIGRVRQLAFGLVLLALILLAAQFLIPQL
jgi:hypothetical protein